MLLFQLDTIWYIWDKNAPHIYELTVENGYYQCTLKKIILQHCSVYLKKSFSFNTIMLGFPFIQLCCVKLTRNSCVLAQLNIFILKEHKWFYLCN